jgi:hypothetical protein
VGTPPEHEVDVLRYHDILVSHPKTTRSQKLEQPPPERKPMKQWYESLTTPENLAIIHHPAG